MHRISKTIYKVLFDCLDTVLSTFSKTRQRFRSGLVWATDFAGYLVVRFFVAIVQTLPMDMGNSMCKAIAWVASGPLKIRNEETFENLRRVFPEATDESLQQLNYEMWHSLLLMVCEIAWAQRRLHLTNWNKHVRFVNNRQMLRRMLSKEPLVAVTGHFGNFEISGYTLGLMGISTTTIARKLDNQFLHDWVMRFRSAKGQHMVDKEGCAAFVEEHLRGGGILSILADQHAGPKGYWTKFMGVPASCHKALALFSLSSGAPMLAGYTRRIDARPMHFESTCQAIVDAEHDPEHFGSVGALTEWYNRELEKSVALSVEQYWWLHRRWREPPPKVAKRLERRSAA